jgi:hypothetical protein
VHDLQEQQQETILATQFEQGLDIGDRLPADPLHPDEPVYLQQVEHMIETDEPVLTPPRVPTLMFTSPYWIPADNPDSERELAIPAQPEPITVHPLIV